MDKIPLADLLRLVQLQAPARLDWRPSDADRRLADRFERFKRTGQWREWWEQ